MSVEQTVACLLLYESIVSTRTSRQPTVINNRPPCKYDIHNFCALKPPNRRMIVFPSRPKYTRQPGPKSNRNSDTPSRSALAAPKFPDSSRRM